MNNFKPNLHQYCCDLLQDKYTELQNMVQKLSEDARNDAKGSAGDKHETALAMMHLEQEKLSMKLNEIILQQQALKKINPHQTSAKIGLGTWLKYAEMEVYISVALAKINFDGRSIFAISPESPLGQQLMGKLLGDDFVLNGIRHKIIGIL